jgi:XTP/dITP diphosphohydrolase
MGMCYAFPKETLTKESEGIEMMHINVVTSNHRKFLEIKEVLDRYRIGSFHVNLDASEEGNTLDERCLSKARNAFALVKKPLIVDDTGLFFEALGNFPGPFPKKVQREIGLEGVLKKLEGKRREAYFKSLVCYINESRHKIFGGVVRGIISETIHDGAPKTFPYDSILIPEGYEVPLCKLSLEEKNKISHRAKAVEKFAQWFSRL